MWRIDTYTRWEFTLRCTTRWGVKVHSEWFATRIYEGRHTHIKRYLEILEEYGGIGIRSWPWSWGIGWGYWDPSMPMTPILLSSWIQSCDGNVLESVMSTGYCFAVKSESRVQRVVALWGQVHKQVYTLHESGFHDVGPHLRTSSEALVPYPDPSFVFISYGSAVSCLPQEVKMTTIKLIKGTWVM